MEESTSSSYESCDRILRTFATEIIEKGKQEGSKHIYNECVQGTTVSLNNVVDLILNPHDNIDNLENIDWCKWLIAGGLRPDEFTSIGMCNNRCWVEIGEKSGGQWHRQCKRHSSVSRACFAIVPVVSLPFYCSIYTCHSYTHVVWPFSHSSKPL